MEDREGKDTAEGDDEVGPEEGSERVDLEAEDEEK